MPYMVVPSQWGEEMSGKQREQVRHIECSEGENVTGIERRRKEGWNLVKIAERRRDHMCQWRRKLGRGNALSGKDL